MKMTNEITVPKTAKVRSWEEWLAAWNEEIGITTRSPRFEFLTSLIYVALPGNGKPEGTNIDETLSRVVFLLDIADVRGKEGFQKDLADHARALLVNRFFPFIEEGYEGRLHPDTSFWLRQFGNHEAFIPKLIGWFSEREFSLTVDCPNIPNTAPRRKDIALSKQMEHQRGVLINVLEALCLYWKQTEGWQEQRTPSEQYMHKNRFEMVYSLFVVAPERLLNRYWALWDDKVLMKVIRERMRRGMGMAKYESCKQVKSQAYADKNQVFALNHYEIFLILEARAGTVS